MESETRTWPAYSAAAALLSIGVPLIYSPVGVEASAGIVLASLLVIALGSLSAEQQFRRRKVLAGLSRALSRPGRPCAPSSLRVRWSRPSDERWATAVASGWVPWPSEVPVVDVSAALAKELGGAWKVTQVSAWWTGFAPRLAFAPTEDGQEPSSDRLGKVIAQVLTAESKVVSDSLVGGEAEDGAPGEMVISFPPRPALAQPAVQTRVVNTLASYLGCPGELEGAFDLEAQRLTLKRRPNLPNRILLSAERLQECGPNEVAIGVSAHDGLATWDYGRGNPHGLVVGPTGSGKTVATRNLIFQLARRAATDGSTRVVIVDPKRTEYAQARWLPGVDLVATDPWEMLSTIAYIYQEMHRRAYWAERDEEKLQSFPHLFLLIEEYATLSKAVAEFWQSSKQKGDPNRAPLSSYVQAIVMLGRSLKIHIILSTQRPDAELVGGDTRDQLGFRVFMGRAKAAAATMVWEATWVGARVPLGTPGRGMVGGGADDAREFQAFDGPSAMSPERLSDEWRWLLPETPQPWTRSKIVTLDDPERPDLNLVGQLSVVKMVPDSRTEEQYWADRERALFAGQLPPESPSVPVQATGRIGDEAPEIGGMASDTADRDSLCVDVRVSDLQEGHEFVLPDADGALVEVICIEDQWDEDRVILTLRFPDGHEEICELETGEVVSCPL